MKPGSRSTPKARSGFRERIRAAGQSPSSNVLSFEVIPATAYVADLLHIKAGAPTYQLSRLRSVQDEPQLVEITHLPAAHHPTQPHEVNMSLFDEIFEQPARLSHLLDQQRSVIEKIAREIRDRNVDFVFLAARGTSDNAGRYANYVWGALNQLPLALATPSLFTYYNQPPVLKNALVVGVSQSGQSPDIVSVLAEGRKQGAMTMAITNDPASPLATQAEMVLDTVAGPENAIAATKTYTSQLVAIALLAVELRGERRLADELARVPELVQETLILDSAIESAAQRYRYMSQCVVLGRGYNYATAYEWALKLKELAYVVAEPYSSADFQHGPVAIVSHGFPVLAVVPDGAVFDDVLKLLAALVGDHQAEVLVISNRKRALDLAQTPVRLPSDLPEWLSPVVSIVPAQLFSYYLTRAMGYDTESPRRLSKITRTW